MLLVPFKSIVWDGVKSKVKGYLICIANVLYVIVVFFPQVQHKLQKFCNFLVLIMRKFLYSWGSWTCSANLGGFGSFLRVFLFIYFRANDLSADGKSSSPPLCNFLHQFFFYLRILGHFSSTEGLWRKFVATMFSLFLLHNLIFASFILLGILMSLIYQKVKMVRRLDNGCVQQY